MCIHTRVWSQKRDQQGCQFQAAWEYVSSWGWHKWGIVKKKKIGFQVHSSSRSSGGQVHSQPTLPPTCSQPQSLYLDPALFCLTSPVDGWVEAFLWHCLQSQSFPIFNTCSTASIWQEPLLWREARVTIRLVPRVQANADVRQPAKALFLSRRILCWAPPQCHKYEPSTKTTQAEPRTKETSEANGAPF